jgi:glycosyltransferase involved in cell wall biosynthesis
MVMVGRNEPCPCGSGRRYKECHGAIGVGDVANAAQASPAVAAAAPVPPTLARSTRDSLWEGVKRCLARDFDGAEPLAQDALKVAPDDPVALFILGRCEFERGRTEAALRLLLAAARGLSSSSPSPEPTVRRMVWSELNLMFTQALSGADGVYAAAKRTEYEKWVASLGAQERGPAPLVSLVVILTGQGRWLESCLASVFGQTYERLELVVVDGAQSEDATLRLTHTLQTCRLAHRLLKLPGASVSALINAGVRAATGEFINPLHIDHELAVDRIAMLVERIAMRGVAWGFTDVAFIDEDRRPLGQTNDPQLLRWQALLRGIAEPDTIGYALIHQDCVAVDVSNLFFSRAVFEAIGGMHEAPHAEAWNFCLRAVWLEEPIYVPAPLYRHRHIVSPDLPRPEKFALEATQLVLFRGYYARAWDRDTVAPNRFAPCAHHWRLHFFKTPFHTGHVLMFGLDQLETIAAMISELRGRQGRTELSPGVNLVGFAYGEFGLGESLRAFAAACALDGIPFIVKDVDMRIRARQADRSVAPHIADELRHRCSLYCLNPDMMQPLRAFMTAAAAAGGYAVGYWYWELEYLPREWDDTVERVDEIWVATEFVAETMRRSTTKPVVKIPPPIEVKLSRLYRRVEFGLPDSRFLFLFSFDFNSFPNRKNPQGTVTAFKRAFGASRRDVGLVIKSINGANWPARLRALQDFVDGDDRIVIMDDFLSRDQVSGLESVVDAYVSLHRAEGLGLGLAESMYLGKPIIGTGYSGNLEFMNHENSCLVDYELVPVRKGEYLYDDSRFRWAEPDLEQAAHYMRRLADDADFRERIAYRGQRELRSRFTPAATATMLRQRLLELGLI